MNKLTLITGNKNYSSWSLRPWLVLRHCGIEFDEIRIALYRDDSAAKLAQWSPSGLVPALRHGDFALWDSLAIVEYINELYPQYQLWPADIRARALARAVSAEMHAGFSALRQNMPMNCRGSFPGKGMTPDVHKDIERICTLWRQCRHTYGASGHFLFGSFTIADAMYAPVALRFKTYGVKLDDVCQRYADTVLALPAMQEWIQAGCEESEVLEQYELYRV